MKALMGHSSIKTSTVSIMSTSLCSGLCHYYSIVCTKDKSYYTAFACVCLVLASVIA